MDQMPDTVAATGATQLSESAAARVPERPVSRVLWALATLLLFAAVVLALLPEGYGLRDAIAALTGRDAPIGALDPRALDYLEDLERQPIDSLPDAVSEFEVLTLQQVPGRPQAAEAVYAPVDMVLQLATPVRLYAHVEAFPDEAAAQAHVIEVLADHPIARTTELLGGVTQASSGLMESNDGLVTAWTHGQFSVFVRATFARVPPAADSHAQATLRMNGLYLAHAVELFQRTGQEGMAARKTLVDTGLAPELVAMTP